MELVRVAALSGYFETMAGFGIDCRPLLKEQGLDADLLLNPEQMIPARAAIRLLERSAAATGCITLGLRMAEGRTLANLGATSLLLAHQPSLRLALETLREFRMRINSVLVLHIGEQGDEVILREDFSLRRPEPSRQASDLALGVLAMLCTSTLGVGWAPQAVCFSHQQPATAELAVYGRVFRCRPQFDSEFNGMVVRKTDLDRPNPKADEDLASHARQLLESVMSPAARSCTEDVEQLIKLLLPAGRASVQICAASMGMTVRTLQRALESEGSRFSELLNRVRMQQAAQYLSNQRMRVTDVADMLGYNSIGAFTRWHAQVFGMTPREWRKVEAASLAGRHPAVPRPKR